MNVTDMFGLGPVLGPTTPSAPGFDMGVTDMTLMDLLSTSTAAMPETTTASDWRTWLGNVILQRTTSIKGGFLQAFIASLSFIVVSELGDKTFFIAAIMAMKHPRLVVFGGAISALVFMTIIAAAFGSIATVIPRVYTYYASAVLFAIFGIKMLRDGWKMDPNEGQEELEEVQMELKRREDQDQKREVPKSPGASSASEGLSSPILSVASGDSRAPSSVGSPALPRSQASRSSEEPLPGPSTQSKQLRDEKEETLEMVEQGQHTAEVRRRRRKAIVKVFLQACSLTFLAEWGDRSQLATVVLATREDCFGVIVGGSLGHALCTGLAVLGGRLVAQKISVRTVTIIGGLVFLFFAASALFIGPGE